MQLVVGGVCWVFGVGRVSSFLSSLLFSPFLSLGLAPLSPSYLPFFSPFFPFGFFRLSQCWLFPDESPCYGSWEFQFPIFFACFTKQYVYQWANFSHSECLLSFFGEEHSLQSLNWVIGKPLALCASVLALSLESKRVIQTHPTSSPY